MSSSERKTGTWPLFLFWFFALSRVSLYLLSSHLSFNLLHACKARKFVSAPNELFRWRFAERTKPVYSLLFRAHSGRTAQTAQLLIHKHLSCSECSICLCTQVSWGRIKCVLHSFSVRGYFPNTTEFCYVYLSLSKYKTKKVKLCHTPITLTWAVLYPHATARGRPDPKPNISLSSVRAQLGLKVTYLNWCIKHWF